MDSTPNHETRKVSQRSEDLVDTCNNVTTELESTVAGYSVIERAL